MKLEVGDIVSSEDEFPKLEGIIKGIAGSGKNALYSVEFGDHDTYLLERSLTLLKRPTRKIFYAKDPIIVRLCPETGFVIGKRGILSIGSKESKTAIYIEEESQRVVHRYWSDIILDLSRQPKEQTRFNDYLIISERFKKGEKVKIKTGTLAGYIGKIWEVGKKLTLKLGPENYKVIIDPEDVEFPRENSNQIKTLNPAEKRRIELVLERVKNDD